MTFTIDHNASPVSITLVGDVLGGADAMELTGAVKKLVQSGVTAIVMDLAEVGLVNSSGLGMLVGASTSLRTAGGKMAIVTDNEQILGLLKMTRLDTVLSIFPTCEEAGTALVNP